MRILTRLPNWLGDVVMATPALAAVRASFPDAHITLLGKKHLLPLVAEAPWYDEVLAVGLGGGPIGDGRRLRSRGFTHALLFPSSWSSAITCAVAGVSERYGYADEVGRGLLLTHPLRSSTTGRLHPTPKIDHYRALALHFGCDPERCGLELELPVGALARERAASWFREHGLADDERPVAFSPGASFGPSKRWPVESWGRLGDHFLQRGSRVLVYGGPKDVPLVREVLAAMTRPGALEVTDVPLGDLAAHMDRARLLVATDSGGRHVGVAAKTPTVAIMGPTHPGYSECYSRRYVVLLDRPACWPCHLRRCPIDHRCMHAIGWSTVARVAEALAAGVEPEGVRPWRTPPGTEHALYRGAAC